MKDTKTEYVANHTKLTEQERLESLRLADIVLRINHLKERVINSDKLIRSYVDELKLVDRTNIDLTNTLLLSKVISTEVTYIATNSSKCRGEELNRLEHLFDINRNISNTLINLRMKYHYEIEGMKIIRNG